MPSISLLLLLIIHEFKMAFNLPLHFSPTYPSVQLQTPVFVLHLPCFGLVQLPGQGCSVEQDIIVSNYLLFLSIIHELKMFQLTIIFFSIIWFFAITNSSFCIALAMFWTSAITWTGCFYGTR